MAVASISFGCRCDASTVLHGSRLVHTRGAEANTGPVLLQRWRLGQIGIAGSGVHADSTEALGHWAVVELDVGTFSGIDASVVLITGNGGKASHSGFGDANVVTVLGHGDKSNGITGGSRLIEPDGVFGEGGAVPPLHPKASMITTSSFLMSWTTSAVTCT